MTILDEIVEKRRKSITQVIIDYPNSKKIPESPDIFYNSIRNDKGVSVISELKFASPSMGQIREKTPIDAIINQMEKGGVVGLSVLTEPEFFNGSPEYISKIRKHTKLPILMKDFFLHESQLYQAADLGANMVLLITSVLRRDEISDFLKKNENLNLESLVEVHDQEDIEKLDGLNLKIAGINNRNLTDFTIDLNKTRELVPILKEKFPKCIIISESGMHGREDVIFVTESGADAILVGTSIMQSTNIPAKIQELKGEK